MVSVITAFSRVAESESECIARALWRRDSEFIGRLVSRYHYRLLRYLVYWTSRREQAEDLVQETWLRVLEHAGQYNGRLVVKTSSGSELSNLRPESQECVTERYDKARRRQASPVTMLQPNA